MNKKLSLDELQRLDLDGYQSIEKFPYIIVLDDIRSMNNVGSAFRTGDSFRCEKILLCGITAKPPHREISKTALGADESVAWEYFATPQDCLAELKNLNYQIIAVEQVENSTSLSNFQPQSGQKYAFVFGNEVFGVSDDFIENSEICLEIPQFGTKHSLNVSVSMGIVIWDYISKSGLSL
jgi:tRNA G18 (ribose-2'-O)-methylase SpoU